MHAEPLVTDGAAKMRLPSVQSAAWPYSIAVSGVGDDLDGAYPC
jgi:hypothetical protein